MSKYNNFESFVTSVIEESNNKCRTRFAYSLAEAFQAPSSVFQMILKIVSSGWTFFLALVALLTLGPIAFAISLTAFTLSPMGVVVITALAVFGGIEAIRILYKNRILPMAIKDMGEEYKHRFQTHINDISYIDNLINEASEFLISRATTPNRI